MVGITYWQLDTDKRKRNDRRKYLKVFGSSTNNTEA